MRPVLARKRLVEESHDALVFQRHRYMLRIRRLTEIFEPVDEGGQWFIAGDLPVREVSRVQRRLPVFRWP